MSSLDARNQDLPPYSVRVSSRAKHVRLTVSARDGLVVVVPKRLRVDVESVVRSRCEWARRALARVADRRQELTAGTEAVLPSRVDLPALGLCGPVEYRVADHANTTARWVDGELVVSGDIDDAEACLAALRRWLARSASQLLPPRVAHLASAHGLAPSRIRVGGARTRWGSCSARGTISLCRNSAFLPKHLLDALILHELAHLRVLDHSPRFWAALREMDAEALAHREQLKRADALVPAWAVVEQSRA